VLHEENTHTVNNLNEKFTSTNNAFQGKERERVGRFLTAHQHKNKPFSAIRGKKRSKWDNQVN